VVAQFLHEYAVVDGFVGTTIVLGLLIFSFEKENKPADSTTENKPNDSTAEKEEKSSKTKKIIIGAIVIIVIVIIWFFVGSTDSGDKRKRKFWEF
jgi:hypothetical protein